MKAVNLIPVEERRGAGGAAGRSGGLVHVLLAGLTVLVVLVGLWTHASRQVDERSTQLALTTAAADRTEAEAQRYAAYEQFAALRAKRVETVRSLAASRFDWAHALEEVARVVPRDTWFTALRGTVSPSVPLKGGAAASSLRGALPLPAFEIVGCTTGQRAVARMLTRLRQIDGVQRVSLQSSAKGADGGGGGGDCRYGRASVAQFTLVVFFKAVTA